MEQTHLLFLNVDEQGNVKESISGKQIIPGRQYDFFFMVDAFAAENAYLYKVIVDEFKHSIVMRDDLDSSVFPVEGTQITEETTTETPEEPTN